MQEDKPKDASSAGNFADFLRGAPHVSETIGTVSLTGTAMRSDKEGIFVLATAEGQMIELPIEAVRSHKVIQEESARRMVQIEVDASRISSQSSPGIPATSPIADKLTIKEVITDQIYDTLAWYDQQTIKEAITDPIVDKSPIIDTSPIIDNPKQPVLDTNPQIDNVKNPAYDTAWEGVFDPNQTIRESIGGIPGGAFDPSGGGGFRQAGAMQGGLAPFVMATPHHAPQAALTMQALAAMPYQQGVPTSVSLRTSSTPDQIFQTVKEIIKEPIDDLTRKELVYETYAETIFDPGNIITNPVWGLPGLMM